MLSYISGAYLTFAHISWTGVRTYCQLHDELTKWPSLDMWNDCRSKEHACASGLIRFSFRFVVASCLCVCETMRPQILPTHPTVPPARSRTPSPLSPLRPTSEETSASKGSLDEQRKWLEGDKSTCISTLAASHGRCVSGSGYRVIGPRSTAFIRRSTPLSTDFGSPCHTRTHARTHVC